MRFFVASMAIVGALLTNLVFAGPEEEIARAVREIGEMTPAQLQARIFEDREWIYKAYPGLFSKTKHGEVPLREAGPLMAAVYKALSLSDGDASGIKIRHLSEAGVSKVFFRVDPQERFSTVVHPKLRPFVDFYQEKWAEFQTAEEALLSWAKLTDAKEPSPSKVVPDVHRQLGTWYQEVSSTHGERREILDVFIGRLRSFQRGNPWEEAQAIQRTLPDEGQSVRESYLANQRALANKLVRQWDGKAFGEIEAEAAQLLRKDTRLGVELALYELGPRVWRELMANDATNTVETWEGVLRITQNIESAFDHPVPRRVAPLLAAAVVLRKGELLKGVLAPERGLGPVLQYVPTYLQDEADVRTFESFVRNALGEAVPQKTLDAIQAAKVPADSEKQNTFVRLRSLVRRIIDRLCGRHLSK